MAEIKKSYNSVGEQIYLQTHEKAVVDNNGTTAETKFQMITNLVNQKQMEIGAVPSDIAPTEDSTNWPTSGGTWKQIRNATYLPTTYTTLTTSDMEQQTDYSLGTTSLIYGSGRSYYKFFPRNIKNHPRKLKVTAGANGYAGIAFVKYIDSSSKTYAFAGTETSAHVIYTNTTEVFDIPVNTIIILVNNYSTANIFPSYIGIMCDEIEGGDIKGYVDFKTQDYSHLEKVAMNNEILFTNKEVAVGSNITYDITLTGISSGGGSGYVGYIALFDSSGNQLGSHFGKGSNLTTDVHFTGSFSIPSGFSYCKVTTSVIVGLTTILDITNNAAITINNDIQAIGLQTTWTTSKLIDKDGALADCSDSFCVSGLIALSDLSSCTCVGYDVFSSAYDTRTWALYDANGDVVKVSDPTDRNSYNRLLMIDTTGLATKYPTATQIRFGCHVNYLMKTVLKGTVIEKAYKNQIAEERPSKGGLDNFSFAAADSNDIIPIVSNTDANASTYESLFVNFAQVLHIGDYLVCYYFAGNASGEYNQYILCAYSSDGTTWTRGFPPNVTPPVVGTPLLFDPTASGYKPITEACFCEVPDKDYPYRMIANRTVSGTNKRPNMWRSADGYHYELMGQILGNYRPDTQYSAVVRGNVIKLYLRESNDESGGYKRNIAVAYIDMNGDVLTPPYKLIYDYRYTSAACVLDNNRELLIPTWFSNDINSAPKTENCYLETFIVEGDKYEQIETNINGCLKEDTLWVTVAPSFVTINYEQYIVVTERNTDHSQTPDKSSIKLVKVSRS